MHSLIIKQAAFWSKALFLVLFLGFSPAHAQTSAQGPGDPIVLQSQSGKEKRIPVGARINVYGPKGTLPIKGRLQSSTGDSLSILKLDKTQAVMVASSDVSGVRRVIWASILVGIYFGVSVLTSIAIGIFGLSLSGLPLLEAIGFTVGLSLPYVGLALLFIWLGTRKYLQPKWKIKEKSAS